MTNCLNYNLLNYKYDITPSTFETIAKNKGVNFLWSSFNPNDSDEEIFKILEDNAINHNSEVLIITDEMIKRKEFDIVKFKDIKDYIFTFYPNIYDVTFFQEQDIILFSSLDSVVFLFSHESYFSTINFDNTSKKDL